ncbi:SDR family NAD(P)-dependent oxidoreductase [Microbacterium horticulturae]|uniref:SDR family NAD(P)-dependent oxidoreductase n=1 Tax=Microbacterium horticulturae TaxID=3028316 RepID=A0ABY8BX03_9MICO|nr:SDR family NAD(P)-dependent oxidoreductase [Microbacterium sp. KACC 23027]WEG08724.1 SDR family NAD(P)-dependent oxidoreductase [Microbacterium sp. KACC 23027]
MDTRGNTVFIPGATSGIGLALALRLQAAGNTVVIGGRRTDVLAQLRAEHRFDTVRIDTADPESIRQAADEVIAAHPDLNVLIAMAGIMRIEDWRNADFVADAEQMVATNLLGPIRLIAAFTAQLQARPDAAIITVSSGLAHTPLAVTPTYNATKAAIHQLSESIRLQLSDTSVRVIELVPPAVATELLPGQSESPFAMPLDDFADETLALLRDQPDAHEILVENVKFLRFGEVRGDYAQTVVTLNRLDPHAAA